jgi:PTH1 family peptidyl-tRNA hydrolase
MKLIIGLGNPGKKFAKTRHNVGHLFVDFANNQKEGKSLLAKFLKTTTFVNDSGREARELIEKHQTTTTDLLIIHDDMDLPLGDFKLQFGRSAAGHKGVQNVIDILGTADFWRLRFGIGAPPPGVSGEDFVLGELAREEFALLQKTFPEAFPRVLKWAVLGKEGMVK